MKLLNTIHEDYHMHSLNLSDGFHTVDEIVQYADKIWLKKIVITDHSQADLDSRNIAQKTGLRPVSRRKNVYNDVEVSFGIEGDVLDETGECCFDIGWRSSDYLILAVHRRAYRGNLKNITQAYINAIHKYHDKIQFIAHLCLKKNSVYLDVEEVVRVANQYHIPLEFNTKNFFLGETDQAKLLHMLELADQVYVNSDMHTLSDFDSLQVGHDFLKEKGFIS